MDFNKIILTGRITKDPNLKYLESGKAHVGFQIAVDGYDKDKQADFFHVATFGHTAEFISKYVNQGDLLLVEGRLVNNNWITKDGEKRYSVQIIAQQVQLLRKKNTANEEPKEESEEEIPEIQDGTDEIPF
jgi:single-strand DNA-binding protein